MKQTIRLSVLAALLLPNYAFAAGVVGDGTAASCTQAALQAAVADGGEVTFSCGDDPVTIKLTEQLELNSNTTIDGGGLITLDGQKKTRHILVNQGRYGGDDDNIVTVRNITLRNGYSEKKGGSIHSSYWNTLYVENVNFFDNVSTMDSEPCAGGGAIWLDAENTSVVHNSVFIGNEANNGAGINTVFSDVTVTDSYFEGNKAMHTAAIDKLNNCGGGGAVRFESAKKEKFFGTGELKVLRSVFLNNETNHAGGALETYIYGAESVEVDDCHFEGNISYEYGEGGAIAHGGSSDVTGKFTLTNSAVIGNLSELQGGGLYFQAPAVVKNTTIAGNQAINPNWEEEWEKGFGAGIALNKDQKSTFTNVTIAYNEAGALGGGVEGGENSVFKNSIIAHNTAGSKWGIQINCIASVVDGGNNIQIPTKQTKLNNDYDCFKGQEAVDPLLGSVGDYGGLTPTIPLLEGSPAINAGSGCPDTDQRGVSREGACDIGAYEYTSDSSAATEFEAGGETTGDTSSLSLNLNLNVETKDKGKEGYLYVVILLNDDSYFFENEGAKVVWFKSSEKPAVYPIFKKVTLDNGKYSIFSNVNISNLEGLEIYAGYGRTQSDMVKNIKYKRVYPK